MNYQIFLRNYSPTVYHILIYTLKKIFFIRKKKLDSVSNGNTHLLIIKQNLKCEVEN